VPRQLAGADGSSDGYISGSKKHILEFRDIPIEIGVKFVAFIATRI